VLAFAVRVNVVPEIPVIVVDRSALATPAPAILMPCPIVQVTALATTSEFVPLVMLPVVSVGLYWQTSAKTALYVVDDAPSPTHEHLWNDALEL